MDVATVRPLREVEQRCATAGVWLDIFLAWGNLDEHSGVSRHVLANQKPSY